MKNARNHSARVAGTVAGVLALSLGLLGSTVARPVMAQVLSQLAAPAVTVYDPAAVTTSSSSPSVSTVYDTAAPVETPAVTEPVAETAAPESTDDQVSTTDATSQESTASVVATTEDSSSDSSSTTSVTAQSESDSTVSAQSTPYASSLTDALDESTEWGNDTAYNDSMRAQAAKYGSDTDSFCTVDIDGFKVTILQRTGECWRVVAGYYCATAAPGSDTFSGVRKILVELPWAAWSANSGNAYYTCWWYQNGDPLDGQGFHDGLEYTGETGYLTHGCVRLTTADAKELQQLVPVGSTILLFRNQDPNNH